MKTYKKMESKILDEFKTYDYVGYQKENSIFLKKQGLK